MPPAARANDARVVAVGAGERAAAVAEQLALEHVARHGGAVEGDERFRGAVGGAVDGAGENLLAGAALAGDEDADVGVGAIRRATPSTSDICSEAQMLSGSLSRLSAGHSAARCCSSRR